MDGVDEASGPSDQAIKAIGDLMNCAIDAIGTTGFLVGLSAESYGVHDLLSSLRTEVSAGLEGLYEVNVLESALREMERYGAEAGGKRPLLDGAAVNGVAEANTILPLGCRAEASLVKGKSGAGGRDGKKSKYLQMREKSMRVGKYSIDRIRI